MIHSLMDTIFITGGAGFIGSTVNLLLQEEGFETVILDNLSTGAVQTVPKGELIIGDLADRKLLNQIFTTHRFSAVMHFAASTNIGESVANPEIYYFNNLVNTLNLIEAMKKASIPYFLFSSTASVYAPSNHILLETSPCSPINPYGQSKWMVENILNDYQTYGLRSCSLRYFNAAGGDPQGRLKYAEKKENLIPILLDCLMQSKPFTLNGSDYPTPDGTCIRDYIHVADLAKAHLLALKKLLSSKASLCYNLGNRQGFSILEVIKAAEEVTGRKLQVTVGPRRPGDPAVLIADAKKAETELGWKPEYPEIKKMIEHAWIACKK